MFREKRRQMQPELQVQAEKGHSRPIANHLEPALSQVLRKVPGLPRTVPAIVSPRRGREGAFPCIERRGEPVEPLFGEPQRLFLGIDIGHVHHATRATSSPARSSWRAISKAISPPAHKPPSK